MAQPAREKRRVVFQERTYTRAEYEQIITQYPHRRFELVNGELIEKMPNEIHGYVVSLLNFFLVGYLQNNPIGYVLTEVRHGLPADDSNDRVPDMSFRVMEKGALRGESPAPYMPDLAIEVQSPGQSDRFMSDKAAYYLANGSRMVWLIYPTRRIVEVLTPTERHLLTDTGTIDAGDVLPGLQIPVARILPTQS